MEALILGLLLPVAVGYLVGAISPATLISKARGIDLRSVGSGNPGASNAGRALGRKTGVLVALLDVAKGAVPAAAFTAYDHRAGLLAGLAAVVGHVTSPFLRGRGGKGVAAAAGAILGMHPWWALIVLAAWVAVLAISRWIALASVSASLSAVAAAVYTGHDVWWAASIALIVLVRHYRNLAERLHPQREGPSTA